MSFTIYALVDPRTDCIQYIGQTCDPLNRRSSHANPRVNENCRRAAWVRALALEGFRPEFVEIECVPEFEASDTEAFWIGSLRSAGAELLNMTDGDGTTTPVARAKNSRAHTGMKVSAATRAKLRAQRIGLRQEPKTVEKRRAKLIGRVFQQKTISKMVTAAKQRRASDATRTKNAELARAQWTRQKAAGFKVVRKPLTAEERERARRMFAECGSKSRAAKRMGISRKRLRRLLDV